MQSGRKEREGVCGTHSVGSSLSESSEFFQSERLRMEGMTMSGRAPSGAACILCNRLR